MRLLFFLSALFSCSFASATPDYEWKFSRSTHNEILTVENLSKTPYSNLQIHYSWRNRHRQIIESIRFQFHLVKPIMPGFSAPVTLKLHCPNNPGPFQLRVDVTEPFRRSEPDRFIYYFHRSSVSLFILWVLLGVALFTLNATKRLSIRIQDRLDRLFLSAGTVLAATSILLVFAEKSSSYFLGSWIAICSSAIILGILVIILPAHFRPPTAFSLLGILVFVAWADLIYYRYFGSPIPLDALFSASQIPEIRMIIWTLMDLKDIELLSPFVPLLFYVLLLRPLRSTWRSSPSVTWRFWACLVVGIFFALFPAFSAISHLEKNPFRANREVVYHGGLICAHAYNTSFILQRRFDTHRSANHRKAEEFLRKRSAERTSQGPLWGKAQNLNILVIQLESFSPQVLGKKFNGFEIAPYLTRLAQNNLSFNRVHGQTSLGNTVDAEYVVNNSLYVPSQEVLAFSYFENHFTALPALLARKGYSTLSAHANRADFDNRMNLHPRFGFQKMVFQNEIGVPLNDPPGSWGYDDAGFFDRVLPHILSLPQPFYGLLITMESHSPYLTPVKDIDPRLQNIQNSCFRNYLASLHNADLAVGNFIQALTNTGRMKNTLLVVYGDHPPPTAQLDNSPESMRFFGYNLDEPSAILRKEEIPLIFAFPDPGMREIVSTPGGHVDIAPTLLYFLGLPCPSSFMGRSLYPPHNQNVTLPNGIGFDATRACFPRDLFPEFSSQCFDLKSGAVLPDERCDELRALAQEEQATSETILYYDIADNTKY